MRKIVAAVALLSLASTSAWAGLGGINFGALTVPTLDEGGLVALVALVGVVGGLIARRRGRK
jgi:hypothetical protein